MKIFKNPVLLVFSFIVLLFSTASNPPINKITVVIKNNSYVSILGKTNVNKFSCDYRGQLPKDTLQVAFIEKDNRISLNNAELKLQVEKFDCGNVVMNQDFQNLLKEETYPSLEIRVQQIIPEFGNKLEDGAEFGKAKVDFIIAGCKETYTLPIFVRDMDNGQFFIGTHNLNIKDFNITPPDKFLGLVKVNEEVTVNFAINLTIVKNN